MGQNSKAKKGNGWLQISAVREMSRVSQNHII